MLCSIYSVAIQSEYREALGDALRTVSRLCPVCSHAMELGGERVDLIGMRRQERGPGELVAALAVTQAPASVGIAKVQMWLCPCNTVPQDVAVHAYESLVTAAALGCISQDDRPHSFLIHAPSADRPAATALRHLRARPEPIAAQEDLISWRLTPASTRAMAHIRLGSPLTPRILSAANSFDRRLHVQYPPYPALNDSEHLLSRMAGGSDGGWIVLEMSDAIGVARR